MMFYPRLILPAVLAAAIGFVSSPARAICLVSNTSTVVTTTAHLGTHTPPTTPPVQTITVQVNMFYTALLGGRCDLGMYFSRSSAPASMTVIGGGGATLPYDLRTAASGGVSLIYPTGTTPNAAGLLVASFQAPPLLGLGSHTLYFTLYGSMAPGNPQQGGSYQDTLNLMLVGDLLLIIPLTSATAFTVSADVTKTCTIGGGASPAADSATIPILAGNVDTSPIAKSYSNVVCNSPSAVQLTSLSGALTGPPSPGGAFAHRIDYSAQALFSGAAAQINTATIPGASGPESGTPSNTSGTLPQGILSLSITPQANVLPLVRGSYADTLRITITPN